MRKFHVALMVAVCLVGIFFSTRWAVQGFLMPPSAIAAEADAEHLRLGDAFLDALDAGRYDEAMSMCTPDVQQALSAEALKKIWEGLPTQLGARQSRGPLRGERVGDTPVVTSTLVFGMAALDARIVVDASGKISGFRLVPGTMPAAAPVPLAADAAFSEVEFNVGQGERALPGTLSLPKGAGPFPAIVLVHGSGPHDRDETTGPNKPFRDLAHGLAERGIAVLRYEKRTKAHPDEFADMDFTVDRETVDDAVAAVTQLRADPRIDAARAFVAGHSLGAMLAPRIAQRAPEVAGLILLAPTARSLQDVVVEQVDYLAKSDGAVSDEEQTQIDAITRQAAAVTTLTPETPAKDTLLGLPARYWLDLNRYDPVAVANQIPQPILIVQGGRDYQVTPDGDYAVWQAAFEGSPRVQLRLFPALNHLLIAGKGPSLPAEYAVAGHVDEGVIKVVAEFVNAGKP